jgi:L-threonylcarbamoyladenylate synthase
LIDRVPEQNPWIVGCAVRTLRAGGVVAYPTEAVYGLGCDPFNEHAVMRLLAIKGRAVDKGLILIAADHDQLEPLLLPCGADTLAPVLESWPGPSTWILPAHPRVPGWLTGGSGAIAVRVTAHPLAASLCRRFGGPLVSTSANRSGRPPARTVLGARRALGSRVDYFLTGPTGGDARPSEIRDARDGRLLRGAGSGGRRP